MRLHIVYRTCRADNAKRRPGWFSKAAALRSLLAAADKVDCQVDVTAVVDGGLPDDVEPLLPGTEVVNIMAGRADSSLRAALRVAKRVVERTPEPVLLWLAEDDYVYAPEALSALVAAARAMPESFYFALYTPDNREWHRTHRSQPGRTVPPLPDKLRRVESTTWTRIASSTSTMGVWGHTLVADLPQHMLCSWAGAPFDDATHLSVQGVPPYSMPHILTDLNPAASVRGVLKVAAKPIMRPVVNLSARRYRADPRTLVAPTRDLATHAEQHHISDAEDWAAICEGQGPDARGQR